MYSQLRIRESIFAFLLFFLANSGLSQKDTVRYVKSPYGSEPTPYFQFGQFKRGFSNKTLKVTLDSLEKKPRSDWSRLDSLNFAEISLQTGNKKLAQYYFENLNINIKSEKKYWLDHLMINYLNEDYNAGLENIKKSSPMIIEFSVIYFFKKILKAKMTSLKL